MSEPRISVDIFVSPQDFGQVSVDLLDDGKTTVIGFGDRAKVFWSLSHWNRNSRTAESGAGGRWWFVVRGSWFVVRDSWFVVRGSWLVVGGWWLVVAG